MRLKPKAARRLLLVGVLAILAVTTLVMLVVVRSWVNERRTQQLRTDGMAAYAAGDYMGAQENLFKFLRRTPTDREAWLKLAESFERVEKSQGKHLGQAAQAYARAWAIDDTDIKTGAALLKLYVQIDQAIEARDLAMRLRPADVSKAGPEHLEVLLEEAAVRGLLKAYDSTLDAITSRLGALDADGYRATIARVDYLNGAGKKDEAVAFAKDALGSHAADPRFAFLYQKVLCVTDPARDATELVKVACKNAGLNVETGARVAQPAYTQVAFATELIEAFDRLQLHDFSLEVLKDTALRLNDPFARRLLARRQWSSGRTSDLLKDFPCTDMSTKGEHSEILAFRALALLGTGEKDAAAAVLTALRARTRDYAAISWSLALSVLAESTDPKVAMEQLDAAIKENPAEPVFRYFRGDALLALHRNDEAREFWSSVYKPKSSLTIAWSAPAVRVAQTLLEEGRLDEGIAAADNARREFPRTIAPHMAFLRAKTLLTESGRPVKDPTQELRQLDESTRQLAQFVPEESKLVYERQILPMRVMLLTYKGDRTQAASLVEEALARPGFVDSDLARRLALVSQRLNLGFATKVLSAVTASQNQQTSLRDRATLLVLAGKSTDALKLVDDALAVAGTDLLEEAVSTRAWLHDLLKEPDALSLWKEATSKFPRSLAVHLGALNSNSTSPDQAFVDLLIKRVTELGGSDPDRPSADVRFARARAMLAPGRGSKERDEAIGALRAMVLEANSRPEVRSALIDALLMEDTQRGIAPDYQAAIEQLKASAAVAPERASLTLRLADLLRTLDRTQDAIAELTKLAMDPNAQPDGRLNAAERLAGMGEYELSLQCIEQLQASPALRASLSAFDLAFRKGVLLTSLVRDGDAIKIFRTLLEQPISDASALASIATLMRTLGDTAGADLAIKQLDNPAILPQDRAMAKAQLSETSDPKAAVAEYTVACQLAPTKPAVWVALANFHIRRNDLTAAEAAAREGLKNLPGNPELEIMLQQVMIEGQGEDLSNIGPLADALSKNPATARRAAALRAVADAQKDKKLDDVAVLTRLADEFSDDIITQLYVITLLSKLNQAGFREAVRIANRAATKFPGEASVQQQATVTLSAANQWKRALAAATAWRALARTPEADVAVGECLFAMGRTREAVESIRDIRLPAEITDKDFISTRVINLRVRSAARLGDSAGAWRLLRPYLAHSSVVRVLTALPTAATLLTDVAEVKTWITTIAATMDPASPDDQIAIAVAWMGAAQRLNANRAELLKNAQSVTAALIAAAPSARAYELHATVLREMLDHAGSVAASREAVKLDPKSASALESLAVSIMTSKGDLTEAAEFAERSSTMNPVASSARLLLLQIRMMQFQTASDATARTSSKARVSQLLRTLTESDAWSYTGLVRLANCAEFIDENSLAISLYERVLKHESPPAGSDLATTKNNLAYLLLVENRGAAPGESLYRAKTLAEEAVRLEEAAAYYGTLGAIDAQLADRAGGIAAYRKALTLDGREISAKVGLADLLVAGNDTERAEAAKLIAQIDAEIQNGRALSPERAAQLMQAKQRLSDK
ncbi:MAG: tetratricopeptide repeat protein [Planctomycetota bacterium]|nr:tetratricopeptide repeat protein [Planctomycetota bacterium]